jgi:biopolymer transport protein ExbD
MRFFIRKRRQPPAIIIVALIDILIVLLIFLMVTTTFKQQPALRLVLPESTQAKREGTSDTPPLVVSVDSKGNLHLGPEAREVSPVELKSILLDSVKRNPALKLAISADKAAPFGQIVKVLDAAKEANIRVLDAYAREVGGK